MGGEIHNESYGGVPEAILMDLTTSLAMSWASRRKGTGAGPHFRPEEKFDKEYSKERQETEKTQTKSVKAKVLGNESKTKRCVFPFKYKDMIYVSSQ